jgi:glucosamine--fructose-6-phosphate aminotransferase (isomerizing)
MTDLAIDRVGAFLSDILSGPDELAAVLTAQAAAIRELPAGLAARPGWRFIGMGSSHFAALDAAARLRAVGRDAHAEAASASGGSPGGRDVLVVAISASGGTREVLAAAERHRASSYVLALTARPDSALAGVAHAVVPLAARRDETAGVASLTYRATVAALDLLFEEAEPEREPGAIGAAVPALAALLDCRGTWLGACGRPGHRPRDPRPGRCPPGRHAGAGGAGAPRGPADRRHPIRRRQLAARRALHLRPG